MAEKKKEAELSNEESVEIVEETPSTDIKEETVTKQETITKEEKKEEVTKDKTSENKEEKKGFFKKKDSEKEKLIEDNKMLQDKVLRITAEMQNMRRRMEEEKSNLLKYEGEDFIKMILPIADNFERAIGINEDTLSEDVKKYLSGFKMIYSNLASIMQSYNIEIIDALNKPFDANTMEAVMVEENKDVEPNTVIDVLQKGYTYKGKVIRHAMVKVSK